MKLLGAMLVAGASCFVGFGFAGAVRSQMRQLEALIGALTTMRSEILYRMTPLDDLLRQLENVPDPAVGKLFSDWRYFLYEGGCATIPHALHQAEEAAASLNLSEQTRQTLDTLANSLGRLDVQGQCGALDLALDQLRMERQALYAGSEKRARSYRTIGACAGLAAAVILL